MERKRPRIKNEVAVSSKNINNLPDECLESIFRFLDPINLLNLADTQSNLDLAYRHLTPQAGRLFFSECKTNHVFIYMSLFSSGCSPIKFIDDGIEINEKQQAFQIVRTFGHLITDLLIDLDSSELIDDLVNNTPRCCSESLISLSLRGITSRMLVEADMVFKRVEKVSIIGGELGQGLRLNRLFPKMCWLELCPERVANPEYIKETFPHLEYLKIKSYANIESRITRKNVMEIIDVNPQLRRLNLLSDCDPNIWKHASINLKQLEVLEIVYCPALVQRHTNVIQFENVEQLTVSIINSDLKRHSHRNATALAFSRLKECTLRGRINNMWYKFVLENATIEKLMIHSENNYLCVDKHLMRIGNKLPKLTEMYIEGCNLSVNKMNRFLEIGKCLTKVHLIGNIYRSHSNGESAQFEVEAWNVGNISWKITNCNESILLEKQ